MPGSFHRRERELRCTVLLPEHAVPATIVPGDPLRNGYRQFSGRLPSVAQELAVVCNARLIGQFSALLVVTFSINFLLFDMVTRDQ